MDPGLLVQQAFLGHLEVPFVLLLLIQIFLRLLLLMHFASLFATDLLFDDQPPSIQLAAAEQDLTLIESTESTTGYMGVTGAPKRDTPLDVDAAGGGLGGLGA